MSEQHQEPSVDPTSPTDSSGGQPSGAPTSTPPPTVESWREQRREARWQGRAGRHQSWIGGAVLVGLGVVFLAQNLGAPFLQNWWALFILIPAVRSFAAAWQSYRKDGRLTRAGAGSLAGGGMLTILALVFLLNLDLGVFWPVLLILGGLVLLGTAMVKA